MVFGPPTRDELATQAVQFILAQNDYSPDKLRQYVTALHSLSTVIPRPEGVVIDGRFVMVDEIRQALAKFYQALPEGKHFGELDIFNPDHLSRLDSAIVEVAGLAPPEAPTANIPTNIKELVEEFNQAQKVSLDNQSRQGKISGDQLEQQIELQNQITLQIHQVRTAARDQLLWAAGNSSYINNLAQSMGVTPDAVKGILRQRVDKLIDQQITAQTFRQARLATQDPAALSKIFVGNLRKSLAQDELAGPALSTNKKEAKQAFNKIETSVAVETAKNQNTIKAAAENLDKHPLNRQTAQRTATEAMDQIRKISLGEKIAALPPKKQERLVEQLAKAHDRPQLQQKILARVFRTATTDQVREIQGIIAPFATQLAASSNDPSPFTLANPHSILVEAQLHPERFPKAFIRGIQSGKFSRPENVALILTTAKALNISPESVIAHYGGLNPRLLAQKLMDGHKFLGLPTQEPLGASDPLVARLLSLSQQQDQLAKGAPAWAQLPTAVSRQYLAEAGANQRQVSVGELTHSFNIFRLTDVARVAFNRVPQFRSGAQSGASFLSGARVQWGAVNSMFNGLGRLGRAVSNSPSFLTSPFRAIGSWANNRFISPATTWLKTQARAGLAKVGAWAGKKLGLEVGKKLAATALGKAAAGLLGMAAGPVGWVATAATLVSLGGDILGFLWNHKKELMQVGGGLFLMGRLLLANLLTTLGTAAWGLGGGILGGIAGFFIGGPVGAVLGAGIGGTIGAWIGSGGLTSALTGLGSALGSAAANLGSLIGSITAPSSVIGVGTTAATVGVVGAGIAGFILTTQTQFTQNAALYFPQEGEIGIQGGIPPSTARQVAWSGNAPDGCPSNWPTLRGEILQGPAGLYSHRLVPESLDIMERIGIPVYATHKGNIRFFPNPTNIGRYGAYVDVTSVCLGETVISRYTHLSALNDQELQNGDEIQPGTLIGLLGVSGCPGCSPHLHYQFGTPADGSVEMGLPSIPTLVPRGCCYIGPGRLRDQCSVRSEYTKDRSECYDSIAW